MGHVSKSGGAKRLGMKVRIVEFPVDLASFNLAEGDLLLGIVDDHVEVFAFLCIGVDIVTTALLSSMTMAGSSRGIRSSWHRAMMKLRSLARVRMARASAWVDEVATAVCLTLRL